MFAKWNHLTFFPLLLSLLLPLALLPLLTFILLLSVLWLSANESDADEATLRLEPQQNKLIKNLKVCLEKSAKDGCELLEKCSKIQFKEKWDDIASGERGSVSSARREYGIAIALVYIHIFRLNINRYNCFNLEELQNYSIK